MKNYLKLRFFHELMKLRGCRVQIVAIGGVDHINDDVNPTAISLPHAPESRLPANIPNLYRDVSLLNLAHVEADSWDQILRVVSGR